LPNLGELMDEKWIMQVASIMMKVVLTQAKSELHPIIRRLEVSRGKGYLVPPP
jgi:hypothetical protein